MAIGGVHPALEPDVPRTSDIPRPTAAWYRRRGRPWLPPAMYAFAKRTFDLVVTLLVSPMVIAVLAACALAIRLDTPGPIWFVQERTGRGGRRFRMFKLRTMVQNAEELKSQVMHLNQLAYPDFKIADDPRITRVGKFLRKTSLDELPQFYNVLLGDMSLVGPRPTSFRPDTYRLWHTARLQFQPGLTGLWQVSGRNDLQFDERVRLDIAYIRNCCFWLDLRILARTARCVIDGRGAN